MDFGWQSTHVEGPLRMRRPRALGAWPASARPRMSQYREEAQRIRESDPRAWREMSPRRPRVRTRVQTQVTQYVSSFDLDQRQPKISCERVHQGAGTRRAIRSSPITGFPRPSRLLVQKYNSPSGPEITSRIRPN